ncbi:MAG TPA: RluA family pseudouridine synthase [Atribacterota bacterium]|nr:RluA family pseudouridine synthase [Atribacterota bacterium]
MDYQNKTKEIEFSAQENIRIDIFLSREDIIGLSRSRIKELIIKGNIVVNGKKVKPSYILKNREKIIIDVPAEKDLPLEPQNIPLDIYFEDEHMMVINKSAGMIVHPTGKVKTGTLVNAILFHCRGNLPGINGVNRPGIVHRLDKETSGLMMVAKTEQAHHDLTKQIKERKIVKKYMALVHGVVKDRAGYIEAPIGRDKKHGNKMAISDTASREAKTYFEVIKQFESFALLLLRLYTGRTHQIRVHLKFIGYPVVGDKIYGVRKEKNQLIMIQRQALHSHYLQFTHPVNGKVMSFTSILPDDMREQLSVL